MFPVSNKFTNKLHDIRDQEKYVVNHANTKIYQTSFIPHAKRLLNEEYRRKMNLSTI